jgi:hypothetical protein
MKKFESISKFELLSENQLKKVFGGFAAVEALDSGTSKTVSCAHVTNTAGCTCKNNVPDSCVDTGHGTECYPD